MDKRGPGSKQISDKYRDQELQNMVKRLECMGSSIALIEQPHTPERDAGIVEPEGGCT